MKPRSLWLVRIDQGISSSMTIPRGFLQIQVMTKTLFRMQMNFKLKLPALVKYLQSTAGPIMNLILQTWQLMVVPLAAWLNHQQQAVVDYLRTENQVRKDKFDRRPARSGSEPNRPVNQTGSVRQIAREFEGELLGGRTQPWQLGTFRKDCESRTTGGGTPRMLV